jgi:hypothetical protein
MAILFLVYCLNLFLNFEYFYNLAFLVYSHAGSTVLVTFTDIQEQMAQFYYICASGIQGKLLRNCG